MTTIRVDHAPNHHGSHNGHGPLVSPLDVGARLVSAANDHHRAVVVAGLGRLVRAVAGSLLIVLGFAAITMAAFLAHPIAGWAVAGVSLIVLDKCRRPGRPANGDEP